MGLRSTFWKLLARGDAADHDPEERVELVTVPLFEAPLLVGHLTANGIDATEEEAFDLVTKTLSSVRILVRRSDLDAARLLTAEA